MGIKKFNSKRDFIKLEEAAKLIVQDTIFNNYKITNICSESCISIKNFIKENLKINEDTFLKHFYETENTKNLSEFKKICGSRKKRDNKCRN